MGSYSSMVNSKRGAKKRKLKKATKETAGKLRTDLVSPEMMIALAEVLTYGATKYDERNWEGGLVFMDNYAAAMRHLLLWASGVDIDHESGLKHIDHAMVNLAMISTQTRRGRKDLDDRPKSRRKKNPMRCAQGFCKRMFSLLLG